MPKLILYASYTSSCSSRVRLALKLKNIDYEEFNGKWDDYEANVNIAGKVPSLKVIENEEEFIITESLAIIEYLEEKFPNQGVNLLPKVHLRNRAKARQLSQIINSGIQPLQNSGLKTILSDYFNKNDANSEVFEVNYNEFKKKVIYDGLVVLESLIEEGNLFCVGDHPTIADCCLIPQLKNARERSQIDTSQFKKLTVIEKSVTNFKV